MFGFYFVREWSQLWLSPLRLAAILLYAALAAWTLVDGLGWQASVRSIQSETPADMLTDRSEWFADLEKVEAGEETSPYAARPINLTFLALHPPGDLAGLANRGEAIHPHSALISGWRSEASLFQRYEVEGPSVLRTGQIDLVFLVTAILPLFLLMLTFDVLSQERSAGRFRMFLVQGGSASRLLSARLLAVGIPLLAIPAICVVVAAIITGASALSVFVWLATLAVYLAFWAAVAALIAVSFSKPASGAVAVLSLWAVLVVFLPSAAQFAAQAMYPTPSRVAYLSEAREAEGETRRNLTERAEIYMAEHPGQSDTPDEAVPGFYRTAFLANVDINAKTAPIIGALERQQTAQRRFIAFTQIVSPSTVVQNALYQASGTGTARAAEFRSQAREHLNVVLDRIGPATVGRTRLSVEDAEAIPEFAFRPPVIHFGVWLGLFWLSLLTVTVFVRSMNKAGRLS